MDFEYESLARLGGDESFELHRARAVRTGTSVLVKSALASTRRNANLQALRRECALALQLSSAATLLPRLVYLRDGAALLMQDPGGVGLADLLAAGRLPIALALAAGVQLAAALAELHERGLVHNGIRPGAVLCDPKRSLAWWVDLGAADPQAAVVTPALGAARLVYAAPECTGRIDAGADRRSDLYAFGVLLYEMLTGAPPFHSDDVLELIHLHVAGSARLPAQQCADIPLPLCDIVMKLLAKAPDERYQSASALAHDLARCAREWSAGARIEPFALGRRDVPQQLVVAQRLVGRETEVELLLHAFEAACDAQRQGPGALVLVEGYAGVGKTTLIEQLYKPIALRRGRFISGKFDQVARGVPFGALIQAFSGLVHQALGESEAQLTQWRSRLLQALGGNGGVLTEVIPEFELIVGPQSVPVALTGAEAQNRFRRVLQAFVAVLATPEQPLVLFLDDLQWADAATLGLLEPLLSPDAIRGLMLLGAVRDNELDAAPRLAQSVATLRGAGVAVQRIVLAPLGQAELRQLVADTLRSDSTHAQPLAAILFAKTGGNPFFAIQFLKSLERDGQFSFDVDAGHWAYRIDAISRAPLADNVVDLMTQRIARLPPRAQYALTLAACIGNRFDLGTLALVSEQSVSATARDLDLALVEGLIIRITGGAEASGAEDQTQPSLRFAFAHDRVQQSAYALIPAPRRAFVHLSVGRALRARATAQQLDTEAFEIAHHLNLGRDLIQERSERFEVAALNLAAGQRAKAATAQISALELFEAGLALLDRQAWSMQPKLLFELHFEAAQSQYLCGNFELAQQRLLELAPHASTAIDRARIAWQLSIQLESLGQVAQALAITREGLAPLGVRFPETQADQGLALEREIAQIETLRGERPIAALVDLPPMADPQMRLVMSMLTSSWSAAFIVGQATLARLFSATMVRLTLQHGKVEESAYGFVTHAITVGPVRGDFAAAFDYGTLALAVNERLDDKRLRAKIYQQFHAHVNLWCRPFHTCIGYARRAHTSGLDSGDFLYAAYALGTEPWSAFVATQDLALFVRDYAPNVAIIERLKNRGFADSLRLFVNWARALQGLTDAPLSLTDASLDEAQYGRDYDDHPFFGTIHSILRLQLCCLLGTPEQAWRAAEVASSRVHHVPGTIWPIVERFWGSLALVEYHVEQLAKHASGNTAEAAASALHRMREAQAWFESLALHCEDNFRCPALLIAGQVARVEGRERDALAQFEAALEMASRLGQILNAALAHELCARVQRSLGATRLADLHVTEAARCYETWGAAAKVDELAAQHSRLRLAAAIGPPSERLAHAGARAQGGSADSGADASAGLDLASVLKVAQAIASEIDFGALLARLLHLTIESGAAEYGSLVLEGERGALVYSASAADEPGSTSPHGVPLDACDAVPRAIVNYVRRSGQPLLLSRAQAGRQFAADPHIARCAPRSVLCIPVRQQGALVGVLYLEHRRIDAVFTQRRVHVLQLLAAQAATALDNARLFTGLRERIAEREQAQAQLAGALAEVQRLKDDLEAENTYLRRDLIANVSHDLRTPLVALRGYLEVLAAKGANLGEEQRRGYLDIAVRQSAHLGTLIDELFELAKLDFKGVTINRETFQFADLVSDVLQKFQLAADEGGVALRVDAQRGLPLVDADVRLMERVLDNLISNALAHTPAGGQVTVGLSRHERGLLVQVADTGAGIAPERLPLIFNRFYRVDKARGGGPGSNRGAGLGLAITKRIVELHASRIEVQSEPLRGTCFSFCLPLLTEPPAL